MTPTQQTSQGGQPPDPQRVARLVQMFEQNPNAFTADQVKYLSAAASQAGIAMDIPGGFARGMGSLAGGVANGLTLGIIPKDTFATPLTGSDNTLGGLGETLGGLASGFALGKFGVNSARKYGAKLLAQGIAEKMAQTAVAGETAAAVAAGGEAGQATSKLGGLLQKAFSSDKLVGVLQRVKDSPGLQKTIEGAIMGGAMGAAPDIFDDPSGALGQGVMGAAMGAVYTGIDAKKKGLLFSPVAQKAAAEAGAAGEAQALKAGASAGEAKMAGQKEAQRAASQVASSEQAAPPDRVAPPPSNEPLFPNEPTSPPTKIPANATEVPLSSKVAQVSISDAINNSENYVSGSGAASRLKAISFQGQKPMVQKALLRKWAATKRFGEDSASVVNAIAAQFKINL